MPTTGIPLPEENGEIAAESDEPSPGERAFDLVPRDGEEVHAAAGSGSTYSEAPVVAARRATERHQRTARAIYLGLLLATVALVATAVVGILRSNGVASLAAERAVAAPAVLAPTGTVRLSADPTASSAAASEAPIATTAPSIAPPTAPIVSAVAPAAAAPPPAPSPQQPAAPNIPAVTNRGPAITAVASPPAIAPTPAAALPVRRPDDAKPAPPRVGPSTASPIVPGDSPKF